MKPSLRIGVALSIAVLTSTAALTPAVRAADPTPKAGAHSHPTSAAPKASNAKDPYAPYAFLIGEWETTGEIHQSLRWGPGRSYIWYVVSIGGPAGNGGHLHQEGLMTYNGKEKTLDFLFVHEPGSLNQEQGKVRVESDGTVVRETTLIAADGTMNHFRQTWRSTGANTAVTSLLRRNPDGTWSPNFPGSDRLEMKRRAD